MPFVYSWYPGPSGNLTLNTHSDSDWNAFPHTHSWHVFFSVLSPWVWEPGDSCACSSFISQQDSKMDHWQESRSTMKTSIAGFCHLVDEKDETQQHKPKKRKQLHTSLLMLGCFFKTCVFSAAKWQLMEPDLQTVVPLYLHKWRISENCRKFSSELSEPVCKDFQQYVLTLPLTWCQGET